MYILDTKNSKKIELIAEYQEAINKLDIQYAKNIVKEIAIPRHYVAESHNNYKVSDYIAGEFLGLGLDVIKQGEYENVVAYSADGFDQCTMIIGAHFDSVPNSPGADDNASAVAGMLAAASVLTKLTNKIAYVAFNCEEDGLLGSQDFADNFLSERDHQIKFVHILEMIGYCKHEAGSQMMPEGLPIKLSDIGDFLAIISNRDSNSVVSKLSKIAHSYVPDFHVKILKVYLGLEKLFPHLLRSDHSPFWAKRLPAMMWTDTSEFRNPNYHSASDLPETLDYQFLINTCKLLVLHCLYFVNEQQE